MSKKSVLVIHHNGGGGVDHFLNDWKQTCSYNIYELHANQHELYMKNPEETKAKKVNYKELSALVEMYNITELHIHHLWNVQLTELNLFLINSNIKYHVWLHDFYSICPFVFFVTQKGKYCGMPKNVAVCNQCAAKGAKHVQMKHMVGSPTPSIEDWRGMFESILKGATQIIAPSVSTRDIFLEYYPDITINVVPHKLTLQCTPTLPTQKSNRLKIAIIGDLFYHKGENELVTLINQSINKHLHCDFVLFGKAGRALSQLKVANFSYKGPYPSPESLDILLRTEEIDIVLIPSICPETFSYTTHEALALGYPVLCFDLGAQAEAVRTSGCGWVVPLAIRNALFHKVVELSREPDQVQRMKIKAYERQIKL
ncbi:glycosyltransferase [Alkalicoccobacillus porphyridii]|uniref:Glycosyltransferase n=1 Tax=Alkalicoccobacillus porphyridii TaxID=2597270 RepID=A0A553ZXB7_9BACI|nr:glycosyltransferase [Alkalicoccobacillus porphyridii]TSB46091.1 glycosyltransferase [Alkalicoccobacillus porphyridii]